MWEENEIITIESRIQCHRLNFSDCLMESMGNMEYWNLRTKEQSSYLIFFFILRRSDTRVSFRVRIIWIHLKDQSTSSQVERKVRWNLYCLILIWEFFHSDCSVTFYVGLESNFFGVWRWRIKKVVIISRVNYRKVKYHRYFENISFSFHDLSTFYTAVPVAH